MATYLYDVARLLPAVLGDDERLSVRPLMALIEYLKHRSRDRQGAVGYAKMMRWSFAAKTSRNTASC